MSTQEPGVICDFSIYPLDKGASLSSYVARSLTIIEASGLPYRFGPMSTAVEGSYTECMELMGRCFDAVAGDCDRVAVNCRLDFRRGRVDSMSCKIASVEKRVGKPLKK
ncbi:MTH1187 family thiamine-binding protein [Myxococcota bacterium]|nr:MTH1187 family thiamine-binding protein [Myxococcota bacterium]MBU1536136.1 MTH1187 family thiamine-binding protein [Myxococcota bacterium]